MIASLPWYNKVAWVRLLQVYSARGGAANCHGVGSGGREEGQDAKGAAAGPQIFPLVEKSGVWCSAAWTGPLILSGERHSARAFPKTSADAQGPGESRPVRGPSTWWVHQAHLASSSSVDSSVSFQLNLKLSKQLSMLQTGRTLALCYPGFVST